jgi:glycosyltransferase involved in cell wall biosynthesis
MARIAHVTESLATGVLSVMSALMHGQTRDGHDVTLLGSTLRSDTPPNWRDTLPASARFVGVPMYCEMSPRKDLLSLRSLWREIRALDPDVVHLHSSKAGALGRVACLPMRAVVVYQPHGLAYLRRDISRTSRTTYRWIERLLALLGGTVVACSEGERAALNGVVSRSRSAVVANGVDLSTVPQATVSANRLRIGTCGRISPQKRPVFFAEVARTLRDAADFVWIGDGDADGKARLLGAGVRVTGWRTRAEALRDVGDLQVYIQTSAWEGMPVSVIEAMAAGLPIVATDIVGNRDLLANTSAGILVNEPGEMAAALSTLIADETKRQFAGAAARSLAHQRHSADVMTRNFYDIYGFGGHRRVASVAVDPLSPCMHTPRSPG